MLRWARERVLMRISFILIFCMGMITGASAETISVAVASNFLTPAKALADLFSQQSGHKIKFSSGSTGKLYAQIRHGAPFDIFMAADRVRPDLLVKEGLANPEDYLIFAQGRLALWSGQAGIQPADKLKKGDYRKLAIANPKTAPYGVAAMEVLPQLTGKPLPTGQLVYGENIAQTYQFAYSGNAQLGIVAWSQIKSAPNKGSHYLIPAELHAPISQAMVILKNSSRRQATTAFLTFMKSQEIRDLIRDFGYDLPNSAAGSG